MKKVTGNSMMPPTGPSLGYSQTTTYVLSDGKGKVTKIISETPQQNYELDSNEVKIIWESLTDNTGPGKGARGEAALKAVLQKKPPRRSDDDGAAYL